MNQHLRLSLYACLAVTCIGCGCARHSAPGTPKQQAATPSASGGRLVPAVVAGFEHGLGAWQVSINPPSSIMKRIEYAGASRGTHWMSIRRAGHATGEHTVDAYVDLPRVDWSRFGDTLRADVLGKSKPDGVTARLYVIGADGVETMGPEVPVYAMWHTIVWRPKSGLKDVKRIGVRWRTPETYYGRLGLDNVRVGAEAGLNEAWSVAIGPFKTREGAVAEMAGLQEHKVPSFPVYVEGWYLNAGTFSTGTAASTESKRLASLGVATTIVQR